MVQSTIDKIKDTTIWRTIRKLAGVIDEQNDKVQQVEDELAEFDLDGVKSDITALKTNDAKQDTEIATVDKKIDTEISKVDYRLDGHDSAIFNLREKDTALENAMPKTYTLYRDGTGKIKAQVETIDGSLMNSNTLDMIIPYQYDIVSGTTNRSFKLNITMSDGSSYTTNDFVIPEGGGSDISVTGITLSKDTSDVNRFHVGINLSDGTMIDSGFISMVDNVSGTFADNKLTISVNGISSVPIEIDASGASYTAGTGIEISDGTISVSDDVKKALNGVNLGLLGGSKDQMVFSTINGDTVQLDLSKLPLVHVPVPEWYNIKADEIDGYVDLENFTLPNFYQPGPIATIMSGSNYSLNKDTGYHYETVVAVNWQFYSTVRTYGMTQTGLNRLATQLLYKMKLPDNKYVITYYGRVQESSENTYPIMGCIGVIISDGEITKVSSNFNANDGYPNYLYYPIMVKSDADVSYGISAKIVIANIMVALGVT